MPNNDETQAKALDEAIKNAVIDDRMNTIRKVRAWGFLACAVGLASDLVKEYPACMPCRNLMGKVALEYEESKQPAKGLGVGK